MRRSILLILSALGTALFLQACARPNQIEPLDSSSNPSLGPSTTHSQAAILSSCLDILQAGQSIGDGVYQINPDGSGTSAGAFNVQCDMTTEGGGWTLISTITPSSIVDNTADSVTTDCTSTLDFCSVATKATFAWTDMQHAWSGCPGARAEMTQAEFDDNTGACLNKTNSLEFQYTSSGRGALKYWNDCSGQRGGQRRFAGIWGKSATMASSASFMVSTIGLVKSSGSAGIANYSCPSGNDLIYLR
jgi:hypothetical protein